MTLRKFLSESRNSVVRERLANYRFFYDVKVAAAKGGNDIQISLPEIDREGYDIVLDDGDQIKMLQLKTILGDSSTSQWKVQKQLLRPDRFHAELLQFELSPEGLGLQGGMVLIKINLERDSIKDFYYYYTDIFVLKAFELGLLSAGTTNNNQAIVNVIRSLHRGNRYEKVKLTRSAFVKVSSVEKLLALANLGVKLYNFWRPSLESYIRENQPAKDRPRLVNLLRQLINDPNIKFQGAPNCL